MTHYEQGEILRRALHAVADTIEPAPDGLERIRARLSKPRPPVLVELAARLSGRLGAWLRPGIRSLGAATERLRPATRRVLAAVGLLRPGSGTPRHEKLRFAIAFGAAALIGTLGGLALSDGLPEHLIWEASSIFSPTHTSGAHGGGHNPRRTSGPGQPLRGHQAPRHKPGASHRRPRLRHVHRRPRHGRDRVRHVPHRVRSGHAGSARSHPHSDQSHADSASKRAWHQFRVVH